MSKGVIDKLQISLLMSRNARLYLLDEPIGGVDVEARQHVLDLILENFNPQGTMIIVTHLVRDIERLFDSVIVLKKGKVACFQDSDMLRSRYGGTLEEALCKIFRE
jgi:ABC-2 type transport system ATP-binding protein